MSVHNPASEARMMHNKTNRLSHLTWERPFAPSSFTMAHHFFNSPTDRRNSERDIQHGDASASRNLTESMPLDLCPCALWMECVHLNQMLISSGEGKRLSNTFNMSPKCDRSAVSSPSTCTSCLRRPIRRAFRHVEHVSDVWRFFQSIVVKGGVDLTVVDCIEFQSYPLTARVVKVRQSKERHHKETRPLQ